MSQSFGALGVSAEVEQSLAARGIAEPFRIQSLVVPDALEGRDVLGKAPTGSGKTLAFGLPIVELVSPGEKAPAALVLAPTRELALQVTEELDAARQAEGPPRRGRLRRRPGPGAGEAPARRARRRRHPRPAQRSRPAAHGLARLRPDPRPRRGRPDARHGLPAAGRPDRPAPAGQAPDDALLGHARRRRRPARPGLHEQPVAANTTTTKSATSFRPCCSAMTRN